MVKVLSSRLWRERVHILAASWSRSSFTSRFTLCELSSFVKFIPWHFYSLTSSSFGKFIPWRFQPWVLEEEDQEDQCALFLPVWQLAFLHQVLLATLSLGGSSSGSPLGILLRLCQVQHLQQAWRLLLVLYIYLLQEEVHTFLQFSICQSIYTSSKENMKLEYKNSDWFNVSESWREGSWGSSRMLTCLPSPQSTPFTPPVSSSVTSGWASWICSSASSCPLSALLSFGPPHVSIGQVFPHWLLEVALG